MFVAFDIHFVVMCKIWEICNDIFNKFKDEIANLNIFQNPYAPILFPSDV